MLRRAALVLGLLSLAAFGHAQGRAGDYGQGASRGGFGGGAGGGGGMGGSMGGEGGYGGSRSSDPRTYDYGENSVAPRPEAGPEWTQKSAVLTPGDRVEYKFSVKAGETLFAAVSSDAFDPALAIVDSTGKELARNDDRSEGDQSPFLAYRFPAAGDYTVRVLSYRSVSGGKFTARFRTIMAPDLKLGQQSLDLTAENSPERSNNRVIFHLAAHKGETYSVRASNVFDRGTAALGFVRVLGPTGVDDNDFATIAAPYAASVFRASRDGDYYIEFLDGGARRFEVDLRLVATSKIATSGEIKFTLAPGEVRVVEFPVQAGDIVRTTFTGEGFAYQLTAPVGPPLSGQPNDAALGRGREFTYFLPNRDSEDDVVRIFRAKGTVRVALAASSFRPAQVTMKNTDTLPEWTDGTASVALAIGESKLYLLHSKKSELTRVLAASPTFQVRLDIFDSNGNVANTLMDRRRHVAGDDLYFPEAKTYIVRLSCDGFGGSGTATLTKTAIPSRAYALGTVTKIELSEMNFGLYEVNLEAGKRYSLTLSGPEFGTRVDLLDEDGRFLPSPRVVFDKVEVYYFVPVRSGRHRLWLRGDGERTFRFELHRPPSLGG